MASDEIRLQLCRFACVLLLLLRTLHLLLHDVPGSSTHRVHTAAVRVALQCTQPVEVEALCV